jgi:hypothetical protein
MESGNLLSEEDFEVLRDPKASILPRRLRQDRKESIFSGLSFVFGSVSDTKKAILDDISQLVCLEGGIMFDSISAAKGAGRSKVLVIDSEGFFEASSSSAQPERHVTSTWIFDCVSNLKLLDLPK